MKIAHGLTYAGLVQCDGCAESNLVPEDIGVCARHNISPHIAEAHDDLRTHGMVLWDPYHSDADGNL